MRGVVEDVDELGDEDAGVPRADAHRQLVAEIPRGRLAHAGDAQVLAQEGRGLDVEVVEGDDAIEAFGAGQVADALDEVVGRRALAHVEDVVDGLARPVGRGQRIEREQQDAAARARHARRKSAPFS